MMNKSPKRERDEQEQLESDLIKTNNIKQSFALVKHLFVTNTCFSHSSANKFFFTRSGLKDVCL